MKITPLDIQQQSFSSSFRGLDKGEVDAFLNLVASEVESLNRRNFEMEKEVRRQRTMIDEFREREQALKDTMLTAQRMTEDLQENARKESEAIIAQAEMEAERVVSGAQKRLSDLLDEIAELKRERVVFRERLRGLIETHRKMLDLDDEESGDQAFEENLSVLQRPNSGLSTLADPEQDRSLAK